MTIEEDLSNHKDDLKYEKGLFYTMTVWGVFACIIDVAWCDKNEIVPKEFFVLALGISVFVVGGAITYTELMLASVFNKDNDEILHRGNLVCMNKQLVIWDY